MPAPVFTWEGNTAGVTGKFVLPPPFGVFRPTQAVLRPSRWAAEAGNVHISANQRGRLEPFATGKERREKNFGIYVASRAAVRRAETPAMRAEPKAGRPRDSCGAVPSGPRRPTHLVGGPILGERPTHRLIVGRQTASGQALMPTCSFGVHRTPGTHGARSPASLTWFALVIAENRRPPSAGGPRENGPRHRSS